MSATEESQISNVEEPPTPDLQPQVDSKALQTPRPLQPPPAQSCLDPRGDLSLDVGIYPARSFMVCSRTLARVSRFWDKMLYGEFIESKKPSPQDDSPEWTVKLPEDNPTAMGLLLSIIHGRFDVVPSYEDLLYVRDLYNVSVITDKYDMVHVLQPWARGWLRSTLCSTELIGESLREQYCHERLWISWALGDKANFEEIAKKMLLTSCTSIRDPNSLRCAGVLEPPDIYDIIERTRLDTIKALLAPFHDIIEGLIANDETFCEKYARKKKKKNHGNSCLPSMLGTGIQSLHSVGLWPIPQPAEISWSISILSDKLKSVRIKCTGYPELEEESVHNHKCSQGLVLRDKIKKVLDSIPSLLTEGHERHLECQARKSGV
ncbi:hypothetical protein O1611_g4191 [Lasiodiplodia mahajangana]|uniref:Uncharacterized protein n=1 Tax=Lasiodiplodia mahajangana TaxID=1108764 RepID=A0ACC2JPN3_9PEZI|nr:hypothetical protein O1611_g4191 [Lasiodiplodia mahajangana]